MDALNTHRCIATLVEQNTPHILVTLVHIRGSAPQDIGAKMVVTSQGRLLGTVGGGKVEALAIQTALHMLQRKESSSLKIWNLQTDVGMTCGGEVHFFFEAFLVNLWNIVIFGAGHVAQHLIPLLAQLDCRVVCIDSRQEWLDKIPTAHNIEKHCISSPTEAIEHIPDRAFVALMTQGHSTDLPILQAIYATGKEYPYIGMIGSNVKATRVRAELRRMGVAEEQIAQLHSPIGLSFGNNHPMEIAISIVAEMLSVRDAKSSN